MPSQRGRGVATRDDREQSHSPQGSCSALVPQTVEAWALVARACYVHGRNVQVIQVSETECQVANQNWASSERIPRSVLDGAEVVVLFAVFSSLRAGDDIDAIWAMMTKLIGEVSEFNPVLPTVALAFGPIHSREHTELFAGMAVKWFNAGAHDVIARSSYASDQDLNIHVRTVVLRELGILPPGEVGLGPGPGLLSCSSSSPSLSHPPGGGGRGDGGGHPFEPRPRRFSTSSGQSHQFEAPPLPRAPLPEGLPREQPAGFSSGGCYYDQSSSRPRSEDDFFVPPGSSPRTGALPHPERHQQPDHTYDAKLRRDRAAFLTEQNTQLSYANQVLRESIQENVELRHTRRIENMELQREQIRLLWLIDDVLMMVNAEDLAGLQNLAVEISTAVHPAGSEPRHRSETG